VHAPHIQREDVEMKLKPSRNDFFNRWNQLHVPLKNIRVIDTTRQPFFYSFLIIKILKWPHLDQLIIEKPNNKMTQISFNLRVKLFDTKIFLLCNNIENNKKTLNLLLVFFSILRVKKLFHCAFLIKNTKLTLGRSLKIDFF